MPNWIVPQPSRARGRGKSNADRFREGSSTHRLAGGNCVARTSQQSRHSRHITTLHNDRSGGTGTALIERADRPDTSKDKASDRVTPARIRIVNSAGKKYASSRCRSVKRSRRVSPVLSQNRTPVQTVAANIRVVRRGARQLTQRKHCFSPSPVICEIDSPGATSSERLIWWLLGLRGSG